MASNWTQGTPRGAFPAPLSPATLASLDGRLGGLPLNGGTQDAARDADEIKQQFKKAMRRLTSTVSIIAAQEKTARFGIVVTSVSSVSMEPPAILVCINHSASIYQPLIRTRRFSVNMLQEQHHDLIGPFSRLASDERFAYGSWSEANSVPVLDDAQATLLCRVDGTFCYGSHDIVIGHIDAITVAEPVLPLLWQDGRPAASRALPGETAKA